MELRLLVLGEEIPCFYTRTKVVTFEEILAVKPMIWFVAPWGVHLKQYIFIRELLGRLHWEAIGKFMCRDRGPTIHTNPVPWENSPHKTASASTQPSEGLLSPYRALVVERFILETSISCRHRAASATTPGSLPFAFGQAVTKLLPCKAHGLSG